MNRASAPPGETATRGRRARHEELMRRWRELQEKFEESAAGQERWQALHRWLMSHASEGVGVLSGDRLVAGNRRFYAFCSPPAAPSDPGRGAGSVPPRC